MPSPLLVAGAVGGAAWLLLKGAKAGPPVTSDPREVVPPATTVQGATGQPPSSAGVAPAAAAPAASTAPSSSVTAPKTAAVTGYTLCTTCPSTPTSGSVSTQEVQRTLYTASLSGSKILY